MTVYEKIASLVDDEVNDRVNQTISEFALIISKKHGISLDLLLRDIPKTYSSTLCKGVKGNGERCGFKAIDEGYCRHHQSQRSKICQRTLSSESLHNHGPGQMFVRGCPGCQSSNGLIDLVPIISNEQK